MYLPWFYIIISVALTIEKLSVYGSCEGEFYVICDSLEDLQNVHQSRILWWKELQIGSQYDTPLYDFKYFKFNLRYLEKLTIISHLVNFDTNYTSFSLKSLILRGNNLQRLKGLPPIHIEQMELLNLQNNKIEEMERIFSSQKPPTYIKVVDLSHNKLRIIKNNLFINLSVDELILNHNRLTSIRKPNGLPKNLKRLRLDHNGIESLSLVHLSHYDLTQLTLLTISHNKLRSLEDLPVLKSLEFLDLSFNDIYYLNDIINELENLQHLNLRNNNLLTFNFPKLWLVFSHEYRKVMLSFNRLRNLDLASITSTYVQFSLSGNPWNCKCIEEIEISLKKSHNRGDCDTKLGLSGRIPYCAINDYHGESCSEEQITEERLKVFREQTKQAAFAEECDYEDNTSIQVFLNRKH